MTYHTKTMVIKNTNLPFAIQNEQIIHNTKSVWRKFFKNLSKIQFLEQLKEIYHHFRTSDIISHVEIKSFTKLSNDKESIRRSQNQIANLPCLSSHSSVLWPRRSNQEEASPPTSSPPPSPRDRSFSGDLLRTASLSRRFAQSLSLSLTRLFLSLDWVVVWWENGTKVLGDHVLPYSFCFAIREIRTEPNRT